MADIAGIGSYQDLLNSINESYDPTKYDNSAFNARNNAEDMKTQFMTLLVAQMKNQDPMNPVDNQDFVSQLAQFSSLEQLITINDGVEKFNGNMNYLNAGVDYIATLLTYLGVPGMEGDDEAATDEGKTPSAGEEPVGA
jgi:flagellar basal-body rod modification protein FlgD